MNKIKNKNSRFHMIEHQNGKKYLIFLN